MFSTLTQKGSRGHARTPLSLVRQRLCHQAGQRRQRHGRDAGRARRADSQDQGPVPDRFARPVREAPSLDQARLLAIASHVALDSAQPRFDCIAIGVSTGGPNALTEIFRSSAGRSARADRRRAAHAAGLYANIWPSGWTQFRRSPCAKRQEGDLLEPGGAWLAPGDFHMEIDAAGRRSRTIHLHQGPPENSCRPAVDVLFRSVAECYGRASLAVVLTGMGKDGLLGCEAIVEAGGRVLAQDEATSVVWGMPGAVAKAGLADLVCRCRASPQRWFPWPGSAAPCRSRLLPPALSHEHCRNSARRRHVRATCASLVRDHAAIALAADKDYLVESRLLPVGCTAGHCDPFANWCLSFASRRSGELHAQVVEAMTTNETSFFRRCASVSRAERRRLASADRGPQV